MRIAAKVRQEKEQHPERFCTNPRCLWRINHPGRADTPCPKHAKCVSPPSELESRGQHEFGCTAYVGRPCICPQLRKARRRPSCSICGHPDHAHRGWCRMMGPADGVPCPCAVDQPLHGDHTRPVPGCLSCEDALAEARQLQAEHPWWDE